VDEFLRAAIEETERGLAEGGIPIGSVLVHQGRILGRFHNRRVQKGCAILHGEMDALENAGRQPARVYRESTIYTTLSPCAMCSGSILLYGIPRAIVGENRTFLGEEDLLRSRGVMVEVLDDPRCQALMAEFAVVAENGIAVVAIFDSGPGVTEEEIPRLFVRLYRGSAARRSEVPGTGLGVAICRILAEAQGGGVPASSGPDGGAVFRVRLPLAA